MNEEEFKRKVISIINNYFPNVQQKDIVAGLIWSLHLKAQKEID